MVERFAECFSEETSHACKKSAAAAGLFPPGHLFRREAAAFGFFHVLIGFGQVINFAEVDGGFFYRFGNFVFRGGFFLARLFGSDNDVVLRCLKIVGIGIDLPGEQGKSVEPGVLLEFAFFLFLRGGDVVDEVQNLRRILRAEFFQPVCFLFFIASGVDDQRTALA